MAGPNIAIVGSADPDRTDYVPPVDVEVARKMAAALGGELARQGCRIVVYHGGDQFIESAVVSAFVKANPAERSIIVRQPQHATSLLFAEETTHAKLFERRVDTSDQWEVSFYRSIADADGVVLIGGGYSTLIAGQVAIGARIPILALEKSGGAASKLWRTLSPEVDLPTLDEHARMAHPFAEETVSSWVAALLRQSQRRHAYETGPIKAHASLAVGLFVVGLSLAFGSHLIGAAQWPRFGMSLLLASMLLGGGAGATIRTVFERRYGSGPLVPPSVLVTIALGTIAGALAGLLYLVAQPGNVNLAGADAPRLVSILIVVSVIGGLTAETVFRKLLGIDVVPTRALSGHGERESPKKS